MTHASPMWLLLGIACAWCVLARAQAADAPAPQWWERGQDTWYYKDDWKAVFLQNARNPKTTVKIPEAVKAAYAYVWCSGPYTFKVNGKVIGSDRDDGTIEDYDLTRALAVGENTLEIEGSGEIICEGAAVLASGKEVHFASDASWGREGQKTSPTRQRGPRGYGGDTHMARIVTVTAEQKAKALVNRLNSARRRILDQGRFLLWRHSDPREVLGLKGAKSEAAAWAKIESLLDEAREPIAKAAAPAAKTAEAEVRLAELMKRLKRRATERANALGAELSEDGERVQFNGSRVNCLGWVASNEPLDSDFAWWEPDVAPAGAQSIALAGLWRFKLDPRDQGVKTQCAHPEYDDSAWDTIYAPTKWGWERWGHTRENPGVPAVNKPYNGLAWYRKRLVIPASWKGKALLLRLGLRWGNTDWLAVNGQFVHDPAKPGSNADHVVIPAKMVKAGEANTLALRVFNNGNIGGIINPGLRLSVQGAEPRIRRSPCGLGTVREMAFPAAAGEEKLLIYASALSPAVVVAPQGRALELGHWAARGYAAPDRCAWVCGGKVWEDEAKAIDPKTMEESWLLLWRAKEGIESPRPLLVVFERRPEAVALDGDVLRVALPEGRARVVLVRPFGEPLGADLTKQQIERCRLWSRAALRIPTGYLERTRFEGDTCRVTMKYDYLELEDDWGTKPLTLAPLPMLFSYAMEHKWPNARVAGEVADLGCRANSGFYPRSDCGTYRAALGKDEVAYSFDRCEPKVHYKGVGSLGEERRIGEPMFARVAEWGMNAFRPQIAFHGAGFFRHEGRGWKPSSRVLFSDPTKAWFDAMLESHRKHGLMCFLNWFGLEGRRFQPWQRKQVIQFWAQMADYCKDLPPGLVCYDLMNEPAGLYDAHTPSRNAWAAYNRLVKEITEAIRDVDTVHPITIEFGGGWAQPEDADMTEPTGDPNTIYQFHFYGPHTGDCHRNDLWYPRYQADEERFRSYEGWEERMLSPIRFMIRHHAEVMHGEFGISFLGPGDAPRAWLEDVLAIHEKYRMHWNWWNYSGGNIHRTGLVAGERVNPLVETLKKYARLGK